MSLGVIADEGVREMLGVHFGRMEADGVHGVDLQAALEATDTLASWCAASSELGERYERLAVAAERDGHAVTAGEHYWRASISCHYGQFLLFELPEVKEPAERRKEELYRKAAPLLVPAAERFEVAVGEHTVPGFVRVPIMGSGPYPVVVLLGGLESTKEESRRFEDMLLKRGVATCTFDGPGQGEMFFQLPLQPEFERYTSAVLDRLVARPDVDASRVGVLGRSLGGHYALRSAAVDHRFKACVAWGGMYDMAELWDRLPDLTRRGWAYVSGCATEDEAREYVTAAVDLGSILGDLRAELLVAHGERDVICPPAHAHRMIEDATQAAGRTLWMDPDGNHCSHNLYPTVRPAMADWLADHL